MLQLADVHRPHTSNSSARVEVFATNVLAIATSQANIQMQSTTFATMQSVPRTCSRLAPTHQAGSRLNPTLAMSRARLQKRQILTRAENDVSKTAKDPLKAVKDFGKAIQSNAEDTAEKTENAYKADNPGDAPDKPDKSEYRSEQLKNSDNKYTPKSDPKK